MTEGAARGTRVQCIDRADISSGMPVAGGAGGFTIAAGLHIPEESLTEGNGGITVQDEGIEFGRERHGDLVQWPGKDGGTEDGDM